MLGVNPISKIPAKLNGYYKDGLNIFEDANSSIDGFVLQVTQEQLKIIDTYEGCPAYYKRIYVNVGGEEVYAYKY